MKNETKHPPKCVLELDPEKAHSDADCGCRLHRGEGRTVHMFRCSLHTAAPALVEALNEVQDTLSAALDMCDDDPAPMGTIANNLEHCIKQARTALALSKKGANS